MEDSVSDKSLILFNKVRNVVDIPGHVKEASVVSEADDVRHLPTAAFADTVNRKFPIHTKQDTWMSSAYFNCQDKEAGFIGDSTEKVLEGACKMWGIDFESTKPTPVIQKQAAAVANVEYVYDGSVEASVGVYNMADVKTLVDDLQKNAAQYPWETRHSLANQLQHLSNHFGDHQTANSLFKFAGQGAGSTEDALKAIHIRRVNAGQKADGLVPTLDKLAMAVAEADEEGLTHPQMLYKVAGVLDVVDKHLKLDAHYGQGVQSPEDSLYTISWEKVASFKENSLTLSNGSIVNKAMLLANPIREYMDTCLGIDKTASDNEYMQQVEDLSRDLATHVAKQVQELV